MKQSLGLRNSPPFMVGGWKLIINWVSSVSVMSDYRLDDRGSIPGRGKGFFLQFLCPNQLWGPSSLLSSGYRGSCSEGKAQVGLDADHWPHLMPRSRMSSSYKSSHPWLLHGGSGTALLLTKAHYWQWDCHWTLPWATSRQSMPSYFVCWIFILIYF
jgi:hypothetical protein